MLMMISVMAICVALQSVLMVSFVTQYRIKHQIFDNSLMLFQNLTLTSET